MPKKLKKYQTNTLTKANEVKPVPVIPSGNINAWAPGSSTSNDTRWGYKPDTSYTPRINRGWDPSPPPPPGAPKPKKKGGAVKSKTKSNGKVTSMAKKRR